MMKFEKLLWLTTALEPEQNHISIERELRDEPLTAGEQANIKSLNLSLDSSLFILKFYLAMKFDFMELQKLLGTKRASLFSARSKNNVFYRSDFYARLTQKLQSFLSSCHSFREHTIKLLRNTNHCRLADKIETKSSWFFDNFLSYSFCYNLRNHAIHHSFPFSEFTYDFSGHGQDLSISMQTRELRDSPKTSANFKAKLRNISEEKIELYPLLQDYFVMHIHFFNLSIEEFVQDIAEAEDLYQRVRRSTMSKKNGVLALSADATNNTYTMYPNFSKSKQFLKEINWIKRYLAKFEFTHPSSKH